MGLKFWGQGLGSRVQGSGWSSLSCLGVGFWVEGLWAAHLEGEAVEHKEGEVVQAGAKNVEAPPLHRHLGDVGRVRQV